MPATIPSLVHPDRFELRYVSANRGIRWNRHWVNVSAVCLGEFVGLEGIDDGVWHVCFGPFKLGRLKERHMRLEDEYDCLKRRNVQPMSPDSLVTCLADRSHGWKLRCG